MQILCMGGYAIVTRAGQTIYIKAHRQRDTQAIMQVISGDALDSGLAGPGTIKAQSITST
jgi:hypothetical protein